MTTDCWQQTTDMAKRHENSGGLWLKLANDKDQAVVVFLGEPHGREVCFIDNRTVPFDEKLRAAGHKPSFRVSLNVANLETKEVKVLELGVSFFKDLVRVRDKYGLGSWAFEVTRAGAAKDPRTQYTLLPDKQLTPEQQREFAALPLHDLTALHNPRTPAETTAVSTVLIDTARAAAMSATPKSLPREAVDRFCQKFSVQRVRELPAALADRATTFIDALVVELSPAAPTSVDPFD